MKEDVLEQIFDDYLRKRGYLTTTNVRYRPEKTAAGYKSQAHSVHSDIDLIGFNPAKKGFDRVWVVSCKSWQNGFDANWWGKYAFSRKKSSGRDAWKTFREITDVHWNQAFFDAVERIVGTTKFTYVTAVTRLKGYREDWEREPKCLERLRGNPIKIITLAEIFKNFSDENITTPAPSDIGRLVQLLHAAEAIKV